MSSFSIADAFQLFYDVVAATRSPSVTTVGDIFNSSANSQHPAILCL